MTTSARWIAPLLAPLLLAAAARLPADEPKKIREATAEEVPPILADLEAASRKKKPEEAVALLKRLDELKHREFEKPLQKLLRHAEAAVALKAAEYLEERTYPESGKAVWTASWGQAVNDKRQAVKAKALRALGVIGFALDKKQLDDVQRVWRALQGNPNRSQAPVLVDVAFYAEKAKDKRFVRDLATAIDEPVSTDAGPTNPPASWWEEKWNLWNESKAGVHAALKAITGQDFDTTAKAKEWVEAHAKDGYDW